MLGTISNPFDSLRRHNCHRRISSTQIQHNLSFKINQRKKKVKYMKLKKHSIYPVFSLGVFVFYLGFSFSLRNLCTSSATKSQNKIKIRIWLNFTYINIFVYKWGHLKEKQSRTMLYEPIPLQNWFEWVIAQSFTPIVWCF